MTAGKRGVTHQGSQTRTKAIIAAVVILALLGVGALLVKRERDAQARDAAMEQVLAQQTRGTAEMLLGFWGCPDMSEILGSDEAFDRYLDRTSARVASEVGGFPDDWRSLVLDHLEAC